MRETGRDDGEKSGDRERMWRERERELPKLALPESDLSDNLVREREKSIAQRCRERRDDIGRKQ